MAGNMLHEPTTLASVARLISECLENDYQIDAEPIFAKLNLDRKGLVKPGSRVSALKMARLWDDAIAATNDPWFGFTVGGRAKPGDFYVLGHAWLASETLKGALNRLCRYNQILTTHSSVLRLQKKGDSYELTETYPEDVRPQHKAAKDASYVAVLNLCDLVAQRTVRPINVSLSVAPELGSERYADLFGCPVTYGDQKETWTYDATELEQVLTGSIPDVAEATDRIAKEYIQSLDSSSVATAVRAMLIQTLPSGRSDQETVAKRLYRSRSTLQRQLGAEGTSYRDILENTRRSLAERYLVEGDYSQAQIAYMIGFADQSNFARAFKRWTGVSPGEFKNAGT